VAGISERLQRNAKRAGKDSAGGQQQQVNKNLPTLRAMLEEKIR
jgi:hypothetical protein